MKSVIGMWYSGFKSHIRKLTRSKYYTLISFMLMVCFIFLFLLIIEKCLEIMTWIVNNPY